MSKFIKHGDLKRARNENKTLVILCGVPGSGKTTTAKFLSQKFNLFVASSDYIRNYYKKSYNSEDSLNKKVASECKKRLATLLLSGTSFVIDMDFDNKSRIERYENIGELLGYNIIKIKLDSKSNEENIARISKRITNFNSVNPSIIGDNCEYSNNVSEEFYYDKISKRSKFIDNEWFDFVIDNNRDISYLNDQLTNISGYVKGLSNIKKRRK